jgi:hypothetical protein
MKVVSSRPESMTDCAADPKIVVPATKPMVFLVERMAKLEWRAAVGVSWHAAGWKVSDSTREAVRVHQVEEDSCCMMGNCVGKVDSAKRKEGASCRQAAWHVRFVRQMARMS